MFIDTDPQEWCLERSPTAQAEAVRQSQLCSTLQSRQRAYLNSSCLSAVLDWLQEDVPEASSWLTPALLPTVWDVVNGTAVMLGATRLVLMPTDAIDRSELEVPQEWIDIPNWAADYYLAIQVQPENGWVQVWGYTTHEALKSNGRYDSTDRTYTLDAENLTQDMNAFWATYQFCGAAQTRQAIAPLPELSEQQGINLIQRLGNPAIVFPRLAVPFSLWGALLVRDDWRQQLYSRRCGIEQVQPAVVRLSAWLQGQFTAAWQAVDTVLLPTQVATAWRSNASATDAIAPEYALNRVQVLALSADLGEIALLLGMTPISDSQINLGLLICPVGENATFVQEIQVRLLDEMDDEVSQASATMTETIQFQFSGQVGERFRVELTMGNQTRTETFEI